MAALNDLIAQIADPDLRDRIQQEVNKLNKQKKFGLVWENHEQENALLQGVPVKVGKVVAIKGEAVNDTYLVHSIAEGQASCLRHKDQTTITMPVDQLVCVARVGDAIYPYLKPVDSVCNSQDSDLWHTLIEADNYHALQLLEYLYAGKVDCIYIDPPYNSRAKDWKYNNDYVDVTDSYRHSRWLSMMEKRLKLAKKLLNPDDSVLIITIDEKEYLHLGCLIEDLFQGQRIQMVSSIISRKGSTRHGNFTRKCEYLYFIMFGESAPESTYVDVSTGTIGKTKQCWRGLTREGASGLRSRLPSMFYPIFFSKTDGSYMYCGESPSLETPREEIPVPEGCFAVYPAISIRGEEQGWRLSQEGFNERLQKGFVRFGKWVPGQETRSIQYAFRNVIEAVESGEIIPVGKDENGVYILPEVGVKLPPCDVFTMPSHDASTNGTDLLRKYLCDRAFPFPKSLYAVYDCLKYFVAPKKDALILDFFAGSGTTLHAVNLINAEDNGTRRCICVTNNEVSDSEAKKMLNSGMTQYSQQWGERGIAQYITWPRINCCILGKDIYGTPVSGSYGCEIDEYEQEPGKGIDRKYRLVKRELYPEIAGISFSDGFKTNAAFFKLGFLDKTAVSLGRKFKELLPVMWMQAGAHGPCPTFEGMLPPPYLIFAENRFAILNDENCFAAFAQALEQVPEIETVFLMTESESGYQEMLNALPGKVTHQLYREYTDHFRINVGR